MAEEATPVEQSTTSDGSDRLEVRWRSPPTMLVDRIIAFAGGSGIGRVTFGQFVFNASGEAPVAEPVVTLAATLETLSAISTQLIDIINRMAAAEDDSVDG